ncbi:MAG TPA: adenylosuccinate synthetase, partial [Myxococcota bacterium]|nr:adenylosuccinate synthetase [Myxococcota bacterium]
MTTLVAVGAQWGDEGKGKLVDWLAPAADLVVRFHGGNNAGHTWVVDGEKTVLHVVPAGVLNPDTQNLIGPGVVVDPEILLGELDVLQARGVLRDPSRVRVSGRAHVILDWHIALDKARDEARAEAALGTTGRGIGPAYEDKVARRGIRVADLLDARALRTAVDRLAKEKNFELVELYHWPPIDPDAVFEEYLELGRRLGPFVDHTGRILEHALRAGKHVLFEGAQGSLLDIDHGTYPYVTSSNCVAGAVCTGAGVGPTRIDGVLGITKA